MSGDDSMIRAARDNADVVRNRFFDADGRLLTMPAKQSRRIAALDLIAARFIPGVRYTEPEVNLELIGIFDDYVSLRRALVDYGFLDRADGKYWRSGGTVEIGEGPPAK